MMFPFFSSFGDTIVHHRSLLPYIVPSGSLCNERQLQWVSQLHNLLRKRGVKAAIPLALLVPLSYTIVRLAPRSEYSNYSPLKTPQGVRYNITNEVVIGALLLPGGLGGARKLTTCPFRVLVMGGRWLTFR